MFVVTSSWCLTLDSQSCPRDVKGVVGKSPERLQHLLPSGGDGLHFGGRNLEETISKPSRKTSQILQIC